jgi:hypothetical protein
MNNNRNEPKQLDCTLKCVASTDCEVSIQEDLLQRDKSLASLIKEQDESEDNEQAGS